MQSILSKRVVPVVVVDSAEDAVPLARALHAGGLDVVEVTFRTAAAADAINAIRKALPAMTVGAGTLLMPDQVDQAALAGAQFGVAPGLNLRVVQRARDLKLPFIPGVMTPSEIEQALAHDLKLLKFFPAEAAGGVKMLKALAGPYAHTGLSFIPLGGVLPANLAEYLALPLVGAVGGTWIAERKLIQTKAWDEITRLAREAVTLAARKG
jgi:2-dehydro-3-deoxyphosphogluconate aldolase/(4S)-4-hydroxy-2-oxoglutarate aldolase